MLKERLRLTLSTWWSASFPAMMRSRQRPTESSRAW